MWHRVLLPFTPMAPTVARQQVRAVAASWPEGQVDDALLGVTEMVTNALRHGQAPVDLAVGVLPAVQPSTAPPSVSPTPGQVLRIEVRGDRATDAATCPAGDDRTGRGEPTPSIDGPRLDEGGRGLLIVALVSSRWGVRSTTDGPGTLSWFEVDRAA